MLKVRYEIATNKMTGWCAFKENWDDLTIGKGEDIVWLSDYNGVAPLDTDFYFLDAGKKNIVANPNYIKPEPVRDLAQELDVLKAKVAILEVKSV